MPSSNPEIPKAYRRVHEEEIKIQNAAYRQAHKEKKNAQTAAYHSAHKEEEKAYHAEYYAKHTRLRAEHIMLLIKKRTYRCRTNQRIRERHLKRSYGITVDDWNKLFELQKGKCPICKKKFSKSGKRRPVVHHCHKSGHVHGLICDTCNLAEAAVGTPEIALALYNYMKQDELLSYQHNGKETQ
jgi:Recombination endonuclease VII